MTKMAREKTRTAKPARRPKATGRGAAVRASYSALPCFALRPVSMQPRDVAPE